MEKLDIHEGDLVITFGGASTGRLQGKQLLMKAVVSDPLRVDWVCSEAMPTTVAKRYWPRNCDTRDIRIASHEQPAVVATQTVRFASGNATAVLPATHEVVLTDSTLTSTFGAKRDHKLEITLVRDLLKSPDGDLGAKFVELQAARARLTANRTEHRTIMSEAGADLEIDGRSYETTHWQIGANNCVFTMTLTAPFPLTTDHRDFFYAHLQELLDSIACVYPAGTAPR
jgi:hypothetical protein